MNETERRQRDRRQCDQHDKCVAEYTGEISLLRHDIQKLCRLQDTVNGLREKAIIFEQTLMAHTTAIEDELNWRRIHESFKEESLEKQREKDREMRDEFNDKLQKLFTRFNVILGGIAVGLLMQIVVLIRGNG